jgi:hypothetical protein
MGLLQCSCGATFPKKGADLQLGKCFIQVGELQLRTYKNYARVGENITRAMFQ